MHPQPNQDTQSGDQTLQKVWNRVERGDNLSKGGNCLGDFYLYDIWIFSSSFTMHIKKNHTNR